MQGELSLSSLFGQFRSWIGVTWLLLLIETALLALIPLFIGRAIDGLLDADPGALREIAGVMGLLVVVAVVRRVYDTRAYGTMRVRLGAELARRNSDRPVSQTNARLNMSREMVDFLEAHVPDLISATVQVVVSIAILWTFDARLGFAGLGVVAGLGIVYAFFHKRFHRLNAQLNAQTEKQVFVLERKRHLPLVDHLVKLRRSEVQLSDTEAILYGIVFMGLFAFILTNLWFASTLEAVTVGTIFAVLSYSWELVESGVALPAALQQWTRLDEIGERINAGAVEFRPREGRLPSG